MIPNLQESALKVFQLCIDNKIELSIDWIPRSLNEQADELSKRRDHDDWQVQQHIFSFLNAAVGPFSIDCFATNLSAKVNRFYAKFCCAGVTGIDAFAFNWAGEMAWMVPPPSLIIATISHCKLCKARGVLVAPKWKSAAFWPFLKQADVWVPGVKLLYEYANPVNFFEKGPFGNEVFSKARFGSNVLILGIDFQE